MIIIIPFATHGQAPQAQNLNAATEKAKRNRLGDMAPTAILKQTRITTMITDKGSHMFTTGIVQHRAASQQRQTVDRDAPLNPAIQAFRLPLTLKHLNYV